MRNWLKNIRESKHMTQETVATASKITQQYYSCIESGIRGDQLPVDTAKKIADVIGFDWKRFYDPEDITA